jgi:hypothetical protein
MLNLDSETLIQSYHEIFTMVKSNIKKIWDFTMVQVQVLVHPLFLEHPSPSGFTHCEVQCKGYHEPNHR